MYTTTASILKWHKADWYDNTTYVNIHYLSQFLGKFVGSVLAGFCKPIPPNAIYTIRYVRTPGVNGVNAIYSCAAGYWLRPDQTTSRECNITAGGIWEGAAPTCERRCYWSHNFIRYYITHNRILRTFSWHNLTISTYHCRVRLRHAPLHTAWYRQGRIEARPGIPMVMSEVFIIILAERAQLPNDARSIEANASCTWMP